jgi:hypothetical protein
MGAQRRYLPRAERYKLPIAILYRSAGETEWRPGLTENISRTGVLFRAERRLEPDTALEMMLDIPAIVSTYQSGSALRRGRVVRTLPASPREKRPAVAAAFVDFQSAPPIDPRRI